jgi:hypothetical protein
MSTEHNFKRFIKQSGFKVLALARLSQCEYSVMLYLLNTAVSGLDHIITTETELASLIGYEDSALRAALGELASKNIIKLHYGDVLSAEPDKSSLRIGLQYDMTKWVLNALESEATSQDAIVFPFRRQGQGANLTLFDGQKKDRTAPRKATEAEVVTWQRIFDSFVQGRSLDDEELEQAEGAARMLVDTHPVDQVLLMIRHFGLRIPTLSLLASSWQHYQEMFESETQKVDMLGARQKHQELDQKVRDQASALLEASATLTGKDVELTEEEKTVLQILKKHRHPRRQLFWAYQVRSRYQNLAGFFADNVGLMLPVTTGGAVVRRPQD